MTSKKPLAGPIPLEEAVAICIGAAVPTEKEETVQIESACGRILAEDVAATVDVPPFARSAMDGYAVRAADTAGASREKPAVLSIVERIYAGGTARKNIQKTQCAMIATGGMLPKGTDSIVMKEDATETPDSRVEIRKPGARREHIIRAGDDIRKGSIVAGKGSLLLPAKIGSLSAIGRTDVRVYRRPKAVVMPTGDEVIRPGKKLGPGQIFDVNTFTLRSSIESFGGEAVVKPIVADSMKEISKAIRSSRDADLIIMSGGSSVGEKDLVSSVVHDMGEVLFHGVSVKPGKPTLFGRVGRSLVFGMPGHPTSCLSNSYLFLEPVVKKIGRYPHCRRIASDARMASETKVSRDRTTILPVRMVDGEAVPAFKESSAITSMANANGYIIVPPGKGSLERGESVKVVLY